jgi:hypothetical protein
MTVSPCLDMATFSIGAYLCLAPINFLKIPALYSKRNMVYGTLYVPELTIPHLTLRRLQHIYMGNPMQESMLSPSQGLRI